MSLGEILGYIAGIFTTFSAVPQIMRVFKLKSAREISVIFNLMLLTGIITWMAYGIIEGLLPVIIWNGISAVLLFVLLFAKIRYGRA